MGVPDSLKGPTVARTHLAFVAILSREAGSDRSAVIKGTSCKSKVNGSDLLTCSGSCLTARQLPILP